MSTSSTRSAFCGKAATDCKVVNLHMNTNVMNQNVALMTIVGMFGHYDHNSEKTINTLVRRSGTSKLVFHTMRVHAVTLLDTWE